MEVIFPTFIRVRRGLSDASHVQALFERLQSNSSVDDIPLTEADRLAILDIPNSDLLTASLTGATDVPKKNLLERAASAPDQLSNEELKLLSDRYWPKITFPDAGARNRACEKLDGDGTGGISARRGRSKRVLAAIERLRTPYYEPHESVALANAQNEMSRRMRTFFEKRDEESLERTLASPTCPGWAKRLLREQQSGLEGEFWGFARFVDPDAGREYALHEYGFRAGEILHDARGIFESLRPKFTLDPLDWPEEEEEADDDDDKDIEEEEDDDSEDDGDAPIVDLDDERLLRIDERDLAKGKEESGDISTPNPVNEDNVEWLDDEDDEDLRAKFERLREQFRSVRKTGGLDDGTLSNTFIVVDDACVFSLCGAPRTGTAWVWAVDPDYDNEIIDGKVFIHEGSQRRYRGFLRIDLRQLVDKFFEARKYHEEEHAMGDLWQAAQRHSNRAFVSMKEEE